MNKLIRISLKYIILNLQSELAYKQNLIATTFAVIVYLIAFFLSLNFVFDITDSIMGYDYDLMFIFLIY